MVCGAFATIAVAAAEPQRKQHAMSRIAIIVPQQNGPKRRRRLRCEEANADAASASDDDDDAGAESAEAVRKMPEMRPTDALISFVIGPSRECVIARKYQTDE